MWRPLDMTGSFRLWRSLLGVSALVLLSGCGWFGGGTSSRARRRGRAPTALSPSAARCRRPIPGRQYEPGYAATDETRTPRVGSIVAAKGGQKAQKEATDKEAAERDAKDREAREKREAADREEKANEKEKKSRRRRPPARPSREFPDDRQRPSWAMPTPARPRP